MFKKKSAKEKIEEAEAKLQKEKDALNDAPPPPNAFPDGKSEVSETPVEPKEEVKQELTEEERELLDEIRSYKADYGDLYSPQDMANIPSTVIQADSLSLQLATVLELRRLNKLIGGMQ